VACVFQAAVEGTLLEDGHEALKGSLIDVLFTYGVVACNKLADLFVLNELAQMGLKCELSYREIG